MNQLLQISKRHSDDVCMLSTLSHDKDFAMKSDEFSDNSFETDQDIKSPTSKNASSKPQSQRQLSLANLTEHEKLMFKLKIGLQKRRAAIIRMKKEKKKEEKANKKLGITVAAIGSAGEASAGHITPLDQNEEKDDKEEGQLGEIQEPKTAIPPQLKKLQGFDQENIAEHDIQIDKASDESQSLKAEKTGIRLDLGNQGDEALPNINSVEPTVDAASPQAQGAEPESPPPKRKFQEKITPRLTLERIQESVDKRQERPTSTMVKNRDRQMRRELNLMLQKKDERPISQCSAKSQRSLDTERESIAPTRRKTCEVDSSEKRPSMTLSEFRDHMSKREIERDEEEEKRKKEIKRKVSQSSISNFVQYQQKKKKDFEKKKKADVPSSGSCLLLFTGVGFVDPPQRRGFEEFNEQIAQAQQQTEDARLKAEREEAEKAARKITITLDGDPPKQQALPQPEVQEQSEEPLKKHKGFSRSSFNVMGVDEPPQKKKQVKFQQDQVNKEPKPPEKRSTQTNVFNQPESQNPELLFQPKSRQTSDQGSVSYDSRIQSDEIESEQDKEKDPNTSLKVGQYDKLILLCGTPQPRKKEVKRVVLQVGPVWSQVQARLYQYIEDLKHGSIAQNMGNIEEAARTYAEHREQFPQTYNGWRAYYLLVVFNAKVCLRFNQFYQADIYLKEAKDLLTKQANREEKKDDTGYENFNLRSFADILLMKAELRLRMHELQHALRPLFKLNRLLDKKLRGDKDRDLRVSYYILMAEINQARKEFVMAFEYTEKAIKLQKKIGSLKVKEIIDRRNTMMKELIAKDKTNQVEKKLSFLERQKTKRMNDPNQKKPLKLAISHFVECPMDLRIRQIESHIYMSDYTTAEKLANKLLQDFVETRESNLLKIDPIESTRFLSVVLYLFEKLGRYADIIDLCESFMNTPEIMERCNPFSLFYILEDTRFNPKLISICNYNSPLYKQLKERFFAMRLLIKQRWLKNPTFLFFDDLSNPALCGDPEWLEASAWFIEAVRDHLICVRAVQVEFREHFKKYYNSRTVLMRTGFEDRVQLFLSHDLDEETALTDMWPV